MLTKEEIALLVQKYPQRPGVPVDVLVGPPGIGKDWIASRLSNTHRLIVSTTSRPKRDNETEGLQYNFRTEEDMLAGFHNGEFATGFPLYSYYYGYRGADLDTALAEGKIPLAIVHYLALANFMEKFVDAKINFLFPRNDPSGLKFIEERLTRRENTVDESRFKDAKAQVEAMYSLGGLRDKFPKSKLWIIDDDNVAGSIVQHLTMSAKVLLSSYTTICA